MAQVRAEVVDGKVRYNGRTLADWAPAVATVLVAGCDPVQVILFGSVARGDDGPDSDIDILVILDEARPSERTAIEAELRGAIGTPLPIELHLTDRHDFERRRRIVGAVEEAAAHEGRVLYGHPLEEERWMPDSEAQAEEAQRWLAQAWEDLRVGELLAGSADLPPRHACFHSQQAAEKAVKAALVHEAIRFPKARDLQELVEALPPRWSIRNLDLDLAWLSRWALAAHYPDTGSDATPQDAATATSAARAIAATVSTDLGHPPEKASI